MNGKNTYVLTVQGIIVKTSGLDLVIFAGVRLVEASSVGISNTTVAGAKATHVTSGTHRLYT
jgi:hypothetical protein